MADIGSLSVKLECDSGEFMTTLSEATQALMEFASAAERANAALAKLASANRVEVVVGASGPRAATMFSREVQGKRARIGLKDV